MTYNILAINPGHNGSAALISDGKVEYYVEEERLSRMKYDGNPFKAMIDIMSRWHVDELVIAGTGQEQHSLPWTGEDSYTALVRKFYPEVKVSRIGHEHHLGHAACAFYNSGFDKAVAIIVDGAGSRHTKKFDEQDPNSMIAEGFEVESVFVCEYPHEFKPVFKSYGFNTGGRMQIENSLFDDAVSITKSYEAVSQYLGFGFIEAGKTMGLAPYGKEDRNIPPLFTQLGRGSKDVFIPHFPAGAYIDQIRNPQFMQKEDPKEWHRDSSKLPEIAKNLAFAIQRDTQNIVLNLIQQAVKVTGINNVVIAGGYGLNCVANYFIRKSLPPEINLYCEPIAHDGGTSIGAGKLFWHLHSKSTDNAAAKQDSIYYGPVHPPFILQIHNKIPSNFNIEFSTPMMKEKVAKLIANRNIVAIFQGRSEAGPRALGNRSILYDPRDPDGKDHVNTVKGREWFRPFAGSMLAEKFDEWFETYGLAESPFMMYAAEFKNSKLGQLPAITHVDGTCRIQTVTREQNPHYYDLIKAFENETGCPIIFNTSFNLAGEPLVETFEDAIHTLESSDIKYLYLPDVDALITKE